MDAAENAENVDEKTENEGIIEEGDNKIKEGFQKYGRVTGIVVIVIVLLLQYVELRHMKVELLATQTAVREMCDFQLGLNKIPQQVQEQNTEFLKGIKGILGDSDTALAKIAELEVGIKRNNLRLDRYEESYNALRELLAEKAPIVPIRPVAKPRKGGISKVLPWNWSK